MNILSVEGPGQSVNDVEKSLTYVRMVLPAPALSLRILIS